MKPNGAAARTSEKIAPPPDAARAALISTAEIAKDEPPRPYPIRGLPMRTGPVTLMIAYAYSGKSVALQSMLLSVATGHKVWGQFSCERGRTIYVDGEQGITETKDRYRRLARGVGIDLLAEAGDRLNIASRPMRLNDPSARDYYLRFCERAQLMVVDSLAALAPGLNENDPEIAAPLYMLGEVSEQTGCLILVVHHAGKAAINPIKGQPDPDPRSVGRGSSAILGAAGYAYKLDGKPREPKLVTQTKGRSLGDPPLEDFYLMLEAVDVRESHGYHNPVNPGDFGGFRVVYKTQEQIDPPKSADAEWQARKRAVLEAVRKHPGVAGKEAVAERAGLRRAAAAAIVEQLLAEGLIVDRPERGRPRYYPPEGS